MLRIREEQIEELSRTKIQDYRLRLARHLEAILRNRDVPISFQQLSILVDRGVPLDQAYRLSSERDTARFIEIVCWHLGGLLQRTSQEIPQNILRDEYVSPGEKLDRFEKWARQPDAHS